MGISISSMAAMRTFETFAKSQLLVETGGMQKFTEIQFTSLTCQKLTFDCSEHRLDFCTPF
jgi:hypothetical protein